MSDPIDNKHTAGTSDELRALTRRVDRLERTNRTLKVVNLLVLAAVVAIARIPSIWALTPGVINALQYNLYSRSGTLLATLGTNTSGFPSLTFFDATGKRLTQVGEEDDGKGAGLYSFDGNAVLPGKGVLRAVIGTLNPSLGGSGGMALYDAHQKLRAFLAQATDTSLHFDGYDIGVADLNGNIREATFLNDTPVADASGNIVPTAIALYDKNGISDRGRVGLYEVDNVKYASPQFLLTANSGSGNGDSAFVSFGGRSNNPAIGVSDAADIVRAVMFADDAAKLAGITLDDANIDKFSRAGLFEPFDGEVSLSFLDPNGTGRIYLGPSCTSCDSLVLSDPSGNGRIEMTAGPNGGGMGINAKNNGPLVGSFQEESTGGVINLNSPTGALLFTAPPPK